MKRECLNIATCLAYNAAVISESRNRHASLIKELQKLFIDTMSSIITEQLSDSLVTAECHLPHTENGPGDNPLSTLEDTPTSSLSNVELIDATLTFSTPAIVIIVAVFKRFLARATNAKVQNQVALNDCREGHGFTTSAGSNGPSGISSESDRVCNSDDAISLDHLTDLPKHEDFIVHSPMHVDHESCSRCSSNSQCSQVTLQNEIDDAYTSSEEFQDFENLLTLTNDFASEDIGVLLSDMLDCVCNSWLDINPSQTPQEIGKDFDSAYKFQYDVPIFPMASASSECHSLKPCSWGFYMCITFYTQIDLVRISAVHCGRELHLLSLSWIDFSSICLPCDSGVTVCLWFQGKFSSLVICQSRYNQIMKIRQVLAARKLASFVRENRIRDYNSFHSKNKTNRILVQESNLLPENSLMQSVQNTQSLHHHSHNHKELAKSYTNIIQPRAKDMVMSPHRMPFLNLVKLLQSAISIRFKRTKLTPVLDDLHCNPVTLTQASALRLQHPKSERQFSSEEHSSPKPPKSQISLSSAVRTLRLSQRISINLPGHPRVTCRIPKVFELQYPDNEESFQPVQIAQKPKDIGQHDSGQESSFVATPFAEPSISKVEPFDCFDNGLIIPRMSDSRDSLSIRLPTAEKSDTASMMVLFTPQPPSTLPNRMRSPRVVTQKELLNEIPLTAQSPRHYVPHKLVARGRFKSGSIVYAPKQQQQASHVTLSLCDSPARVGAADFKTVSTKKTVSSDFINILESPFHSADCKSRRNQMMG